jgi:4-cresol dehydrogenase (hydroxylating) flavoprotein subunit
MVSVLQSRRKPSLVTAFAMLPEGSVIRDASEIGRRYQRNVTALSRSIPMVLRPENAQQVAAIVEEANVRGIALYPISTGKNWGLGSKLPVTDGTVLLDLSRLNRIVEINEPLRYAVLEPGVTQGQLAHYLAEHHPSLTFNLTGTFGETSIVGNTLERGDGMYARIDDLIALHGILGNGEPFSVGGHGGSSGADTSHVMRYAAGPDLVGLFTQSNFGVITQMVFRLLPWAERRHLFWGVAEDARLAELFDRLQHLFTQRIVQPGRVNVGYANRFEQARSTLGDKTADMRYTGELWNYHIIVDGSIKLTNVILEELRDQLAPCCVETGHFEMGGDPASLPPFLKPGVRPFSGFPDHDNIRLVYKLTGVEPPADPLDLDVDQTPFGMKSYVAIVPPLGEHIRKAAELIAAVRKRFKLNIKPSFFGDGRTLVTIHFVATDVQQVNAAEQADTAIWESMTQAGYMPYRVAIDRMEQLVNTRPEVFALAAHIKTVFDPKNVISPGRYCPL